jgi:hypothetical protein
MRLNRSSDVVKVPIGRRRGAHYDTFQALDGGQVARTLRRQALDLQVAGAVIEESRAIELRCAALQCVLPVSVAAAHRTPVDRAVCVHELRGHNPDAGALGSLHSQTRHQRGVLTEVVHGAAAGQFCDVNRRQHLKGADGRRGTRHPFQQATRPVGHDGGSPRPLVEAGLIPTGWLGAAIEVFAAEHAREGDRTGTGSPLAVGADDLGAAIRKLEPQVRDCRQRPHRGCELRIPPSRYSVHPAAKQQPDRVWTCPDVCGDVARVVQARPVVFRPARCQYIRTDLLAVDRQLVLSETSHVHDRAREPWRHHELTPCQQGGALRRSSDPPRTPFARAEHAHGPRRHGAPGRRRSVLVPHPHLPEDLLGGRQLPASVGHLRGLLRRNLSGVPDIALLTIEAGARCRDEDAVAGLTLARGRAGERP